MLWRHRPGSGSSQASPALPASPWGHCLATAEIRRPLGWGPSASRAETRPTWGRPTTSQRHRVWAPRGVGKGRPPPALGSAAPENVHFGRAALATGTPGTGFGGAGSGLAVSHELQEEPGLGLVALSSHAPLLQPRETPPAPGPQQQQEVPGMTPKYCDRHLRRSPRSSRPSHLLCPVNRSGRQGHNTQSPPGTAIMGLSSLETLPLTTQTLSCCTRHTLRSIGSLFRKRQHKDTSAFSPGVSS